MKRDCPDEQTMACFIERRLPEGERREIEKHIEECAWCREIVLVTEIAWSKGKNGSLLKVPKDLVERIKALVKEKASLN